MIIISTVNSYISCTDYLIEKIVLILFDIFTTKNYRWIIFLKKKKKKRKRKTIILNCISQRF